MSRVLFINGPAEGHINPTLGVVSELIRQGEEVVYFTTEQFRTRIEKTGAIVRTYDGSAFMSAFLAGNTNHILDKVTGLLRTSDVIVPSVIEQTKGDEFDYIIHDSMFGCGRLLAQMLHLPAVNSCTSFAQTKQSFDFILNSVSRQSPASINTQVESEFEQMLATVNAKYGVDLESAYDVFCNPAPLSIVYTTRQFQPHGESFDDTYKFVGPSISERGSQDKWDLDLENKQVIYISLGTVIRDVMDFYKICFEALGDTEYTVVASVGRHTDISDLGNIPPNFIVRNYVPQTEVLRQTQVFITHGGMNSTSEGLFYGVPLIVIPHDKDQPFIARRVAELGAGIQLQKDNLSANELRKAVDEVVKNQDFRKVVSEMSKSFQQAGGYQQAVREIFAFKHKTGIQ
jgi:MGT family glycosyltransferase